MQSVDATDESFCTVTVFDPVCAQLEEIFASQSAQAQAQGTLPLADGQTAAGPGAGLTLPSAGATLPSAGPSAGATASVLPAAPVRSSADSEWVSISSQLRSNESDNSTDL